MAQIRPVLPQMVAVAKKQKRDPFLVPGPGGSSMYVKPPRPGDDEKPTKKKVSSEDKEFIKRAKGKQ